MVIFKRLSVLLLIVSHMSFSMDIDDASMLTHLRTRKCKDNSSEKIAQKKEKLKSLIYERIAAVRAGKKDRSFLEEPMMPTDHFYKTLLTKAVRYSLEKEIGELLSAGADSFGGKLKIPISEAKDITTARLLLKYSNYPNKYNKAFAVFLRTFNRWTDVSQRKEYLTWLLANGVNPNEQIKSDTLPLITLGIGDTYWKQPAREEITFLIQYGADPDKKDIEMEKSANECFKIQNPALVTLMKEERAKFLQQTS